MLIQVKLLQFASKKFTYSVPESLQSKMAAGLLVQVPLKKQIVPAVVAEIDTSGQVYNFAIKSIAAIYPFPQDFVYSHFIATIGHYYQIDSSSFLHRIQHFLSEKEQESSIFVPNLLATSPDDVVFSQEQQTVYEAIAPAVALQKQETFLLHGVTGSGKTEIYKRLAQDCLAQGKTVILMLPEVCLALRFQKIFAAHFVTVPVIGFHSAASVSQKKLLWQLLLESKPMIIVGVHMPILLPIANLGLILVDEEHDPGYQEKKHPKLHSRDMAILKASLYHVPIVLGSATPSVQTLFNVQKRGWKKVEMLERFAGKFPTIQLVSMKKNKKRKNFWITDELFAAIENRLDKGEQAIIFLNRRGYSFFVQCVCGFIFSCHQCSVSLTLHSDQSLICHYCGHKEFLAQKCPECFVHSDEFLKKGIGTQQVVSILQKLFPSARIERADLDSTTKKRSWAQTVEQMQNKEIDILVGTQSITKGYHFPGVTLVGVLWADLNLHFPVYNAAETSLQQLIQVAGRAGRQSDDSLVIIQAFDEHKIFQFLNEIDYQKFYDYEIAKRIEVGYPPFKHICEIELKSNDQAQVQHEAKLIVACLQKMANKQNMEVSILGPVPAIVHKIKSVYSYKLYAKSMSRNQIIQLFSFLPQDQFQSSIYFTIDPV
ncbi:primosomal protein N' [Candidatus Babeliales bacterium]|nr:primosomal protein N' [Candidatus Babeliales bacterium]